MQIEILFTLLIFGISGLEKMTWRKIVGALIMLMGTIFIIYNGNTKINSGELMIMAGTFFYPIGNIFAKKALKIGSPSAILFIRSFLGGLTLIGISMFFENQTTAFTRISQTWPLIIFNGIFIFHISKVFWYEGIKRIDVSKAIPMTAGSGPAFSLLFAMVFLKEIRQYTNGSVSRW